MAVHHHKSPIVTDGLVFQVDASNKLGGNVSNTRNLVSPTQSGTFVNGASVVDGAFDFDGVDDYIDFIPMSLSTISIEAWVFANTLGSYNAVATQWRENTNSVSSWTLETVGNDIRLYITEGSTLYFASTPFTTGQWYHIVGTYDNTTVKIYSNGVLGPTTGTPPSMNSSTLNVEIGALYNVSGVPGVAGNWDGNISNVKIYNRSLTSEEITQNYEVTKHKFE